MTPGPQFQQLAMFHTAGELRHNVTPLDAWQHKSPQAMWDHKLEQAKSWSADLGQRQTPGATTLHASIAAGGVRQPVELMHSPTGTVRLMEGHHRVAAAFAHDPKSLIPVLHDQFHDKPMPASSRPRGPHSEIALGG